MLFRNNDMDNITSENILSNNLTKLHDLGKWEFALFLMSHEKVAFMVVVVEDASYLKLYLHIYLLKQLVVYIMNAVFIKLSYVYFKILK